MDFVLSQRVMRWCFTIALFILFYFIIFFLLLNRLLYVHNAHKYSRSLSLFGIHLKNLLHIPQIKFLTTYWHTYT